MCKNELLKAWYGQFANGEITCNCLHVDVVHLYLGHTRGRYLVVPALVRNDETARSALKKRPTRPLVIQAEVPGKALRTTTDSTGIGGRKEEAKALSHGARGTQNRRYLRHHLPRRIL
jgi:hypothetical protein